MSCLKQIVRHWQTNTLIYGIALEIKCEWLCSISIKNGENFVYIREEAHIYLLSWRLSLQVVLDVWLIAASDTPQHIARAFLSHTSHNIL